MEMDRLVYARLELTVVELHEQDVLTESIYNPWPWDNSAEETANNGTIFSPGGTI